MWFDVENMQAVPDEMDRKNAKSLVYRYRLERGNLLSNVLGNGSEEDRQVLNRIRIREIKIDSLT